MKRGPLGRRSLPTDEVTERVQRRPRVRTCPPTWCSRSSRESDADESSHGSADLPEIDLEGIPEMESEPVIAPAPAMQGAMDDMGSETIDLETLDLGEEPTVIDAVPEQFEEIEELRGRAEDPELETTDEVDLEALAAEAEELEDNVAGGSGRRGSGDRRAGNPARTRAGPAEYAREGDRDQLRRGPRRGRGSPPGICGLRASR